MTTAVSMTALLYENSNKVMTVVEVKTTDMNKLKTVSPLWKLKSEVVKCFIREGIRTKVEYTCRPN